MAASNPGDYLVDATFEAGKLRVCAFELESRERFEETFVTEDWNKEKVKEALDLRQYTIKERSPSQLKLSVFSDVITLVLPLTQSGSPVDSLLAKHLGRLLQVPAVLSLTSDSATTGSIIWNKTLVNTSPSTFLLSADQKSVTIHQSGIYRFDVKILAPSGKNVYPYLSVGETSHWFYGGGSGYNDATLSIVLDVPPASVVTIGFQPSGNQVYPRYHYLSIQKII